MIKAFQNNEHSQIDCFKSFQCTFRRSYEQRSHAKLSILELYMGFRLLDFQTKRIFLAQSAALIEAITNRILN
jgi:hypothetical protein